MPEVSVQTKRTAPITQPLARQISSQPINTRPAGGGVGICPLPFPPKTSKHVKPAMLNLQYLIVHQFDTFPKNLKKSIYFKCRISNAMPRRFCFKTAKKCKRLHLPFLRNEDASKSLYVILLPILNGNLGFFIFTHELKNG